MVLSIRRLTVSILAAAIAAGLFPSATATAADVATRPEVGVMYHATWNYDDDAQRIEALDKMAEAGVEVVRIDVAWCSVQSSGPNSYAKWYLDRLNLTINAARARGIEVLLVLFCTPAWATSNPSASWETASPMPPKDPGDYGRVAGWLANYFRGRTVGWEIWNEPNHPRFWSGTPSEYVRILKAAYPAIKAADPQARVVSGGTSYTDARWIETLYELGSRPFFDVMAIHPYMAPADLPPETENGEMWTISAVGGVRRLMDRYGDDNKEIWFTEFGWSSHSNQYPSCKEVYGSNKDEDLSDGKGCSSNGTMGVTAEEQGEYLVRAVQYVTRKNQSDGWNVTKMLWYNDRNRVSGNVHEDNFGLFRRDMTEKPVYWHLRSFLTGASLERPSDNLLSNGGFESGGTGWDATREQLGIVDNARSGSRAGKVTDKGDTTTNRLRADRVGTGSRGVTFEARGFAAAVEGSPRLELIIVERASGTVVGRQEVVTRIGSTWTRLNSLTYVSQRGDSSLKLKVKALEDGFTGAFLVDDFKLLRY